MNWWLVWLIVFLVGLSLMSYYFSKRIKSSDEYIMANFSLGYFPIAGSIVATALGASAIIGNAGKGYSMGMSWFTAMIPHVIVSIILAIVLGATIRKLKLYTVPDLFVRRFGKAAGLIPALVVSILYMTPVFGMQIVGMGSILTSIVGMPLFWAMILGFVVCVLFTLFGGMPGVSWTDAVQSILIVAGLITMFFMGLQQVGGFQVVLDETPAELLSFFSLKPMDMFNYIVIYGPFYIVWQTTWQRFSAAKTEKIAVRAVTAGYVLCGIVGIFAVGIGVIAHLALPAGTADDLVYTNFMTMVAHPAIGGLFMVSLFAAVLTGATSFLLSGATNISNDIYRNWVNPKATDEKLLKVSRLAVSGMALVGLGIALFIKDIILIFTYALSLSAVTLVMPVLAAMFWKRATKAGVISSTVVSLLFAIAWKLIGNPFGLHEIVPGIMVSFLVLVIVSLLTKHSEDEEVIAYYFALKNEIDPALKLEQQNSSEIEHVRL